jgi:hypothetical protein
MVTSSNATKARTTGQDGKAVELAGSSARSFCWNEAFERSFEVAGENQHADGRDDREPLKEKGG